MNKAKKLQDYLKVEYDLSNVDINKLYTALCTTQYVKEYNENKSNKNRTPIKDYKHLELIGDKVLGLSLADYYVSKKVFDQENLNNKLQSHENNDNLKCVCNTLHLDKFVYCSENESIKGTKVEANLVEALFGAIFMSIGYKDTKRFILKVLGIKE